MVVAGRPGAQRRGSWTGVTSIKQVPSHVALLSAAKQGNVNHVGCACDNPSQVAALTRVLENQSPDLDVRDGNGQTALMLACGIVEERGTR